MHRYLIASALLSPLLFTAVAVASQSPNDDSYATTQSLPAGTGVTPARVVYVPGLALNSRFNWRIPNGAELLVRLNVDQDGMAQDIRVVDSTKPALSEPVIDAVRKIRFRPAKLNGRPVPVDMNLIVDVAPVMLQQ
jgi:hypothetical protein